MYLNCKTYFSFRYGTFSSKELVKAAVDNGVTALALTNINSTCAICDFVKYCREEYKTHYGYRGSQPRRIIV